MKRSLYCLIVAILFLAAAPPVFSSSRAIRAKAFVLLDADDSVLISRNASVKLPPASTVKLMTAMVVLDLLEPDAVVTVSDRSARLRGRPRLRTGDVFTVEDLLHLALMKSSNAAAVALAEAAGGTEEGFVELMNARAREIGANDTFFGNASGLPGTGQYTTAMDLTIILKQAITYPLIREILGKKEADITTVDGRALSIGNTDALLWYRDDMVGGKTGFTNRAQHCFVGAIETEKGILYTAVLGAPSRSRLWKSTSMLVDLSNDPEFAPSIITVDDTPAEKPRKRRTKKSKRR